ncbi:MAG: Asp23/Gls24 family envelope stress response protein, partial [Acutalibacteraceae bacterium]
MIAYENHLGKIKIKEAYFEKLIGDAVSQCYGVSNMIPKGGLQKLRSLLSKKFHEDTGIKVRGDIKSLIVDLHISVVYGLNINEISKSIVNKVTYV